MRSLLCYLVVLFATTSVCAEEDYYMSLYPEFSEIFYVEEDMDSIMILDVYSDPQKDYDGDDVGYHEFLFIRDNRIIATRYLVYDNNIVITHEQDKLVFKFEEYAESNKTVYRMIRCKNIMVNDKPRPELPKELWWGQNRMMTDLKHYK